MMTYMPLETKGAFDALQSMGQFQNDLKDVAARYDSPCNALFCYLDTNFIMTLSYIVH